MSKIKFNHKLWLIAQTSCSIILALLLMVSSTFALSQSNLEFFATNGIYYYNPSGSNVSCTTGSMMNYSGAQILSSAQQEAIQANQPFYEAGSAKALADYGYNLPWQVLATLHYKEHGLQRDNPANGQGAYQLYSYTAGGTNANAFRPAGPISDEEFQRQTDIVVGLIATSYGSGLDLTNPNDVKRMFFKYNGAATQYYDRAIAMGFSDEEARNGEGSTYVMNRYDARRDPASPEMSPLWRGRFTHDGHWEPDSVSDQTFGAFVVYEALGGGGVCSGQLVSGGMNIDDAEALMAEYRALQDQYKDCPDAHTVNGVTYCSEYHVQKVGCIGGPFANCVGFSQYFINRYTSFSQREVGIGGLPNGINVVSTLISRGFEDGGTTPRAYAIFSGPGSGSEGHTGVVLGIDIENNVVITGEAGCNDPNYTGVHRRDLDTMSNGRYTFAYSDQFLNL